MSKKVIFSTGFSGKVATAPYENCSPFFHITEEIEADFTPEQIEAHLKELQDICQRRFRFEENALFYERVQKSRPNIRLYDKAGKKYVSVTTVLGHDKQWFIDPEQLKLYAARGTINHLRAEYFFKNGKWEDPTKLESCFPYLALLKGTELWNGWEGANLPAFLEKHPIKKVVSYEQKVFNEELSYAGTYDFLAETEVGLTLFDIKTTDKPDTESAFPQLAAYANSDELRGKVKQIIIAPVHGKTKQGFSSAIVCGEEGMQKWFGIFSAKRSKFREIYGI